MEIEDVKQLMKRQYLTYASYVILDRAIPDVFDGLKPVQRRILHTLWNMHDGKLHKVANVAGQTMAFHPHGDSSIIEALVNISNKGYLLDQQGNFGNIFTGDSAAAGRYIETRLSLLAKETMFNPDLTQYQASYDGRNQEPLCLPAKIPLLLMQGTDGIAVGMSTHILPHNFVELLEAEIAWLEEEREIEVLPDFPTGGIMDASDYQGGKGKVKLRARIEIKDVKTIVITEVCYGTTTESLIRTIDEAAKRGKIRIESINDYTASKVEIEIKLPRGCYADELINSLYAYTECEVMLTSQVLAIKDNLPCELDVQTIVKLYAEKIQTYHRRELELDKERLLEKIFDKTLEQIFIENRIYKKIENIAVYEEIHSVIASGLELFHHLLSRIPTHDDRERLLNIPIRRISRFDLNKNQEEVMAMQNQLVIIEKHLRNIKKYSANYLRDLIKKYGANFPRKTQHQEIEQLNIRAIETRMVKVGFDAVSGFVGTKITTGTILECTNFDKILLFFKDGTYTVINIPEKHYVHQDGNKAVFVGIADKKTTLTAIYKDPKTHICFGKRFIIKQFIMDKAYHYMEENMELLLLSVQQNLNLELQFIPKIGQRTTKMSFDTNKILVKDVKSKGLRLCTKEVKKIVVVK